MSDDGGADDREVGYGKPPAHTRFMPGQSGNPGGRPKGPRSLARDLVEELQESVTLNDGEGERTLSKQRSILRSLTAKAIAGDARATTMVLDLVQRLIGAGPAGVPAGERAGGAPGGAPGGGPGGWTGGWTGGAPDPSPECDGGESARERLAAKIEEMHRKLNPAARPAEANEGADSGPDAGESGEPGEPGSGA